ncbi:proton-conducting membrane transporter [Nitrosospira sp. Nsp2]|uniref:NADH-quinone oxidoreductase subunit N n=1 Tax=Nitrosospira sp. Nsp2 TaxID=136548 RepID=UPI000D40EFDE|nr:proton-conducting membrane transporter [Nitrosospira sp. Nsp2]
MLKEGLGGLAGDWQDMLIILAVMSMILGNFAAIAQTNIKRMRAYSTISHSFVLLGIIAADGSGYSAAMFYVMAYMLMTLGNFGAIMLLSVRALKEADKLDDFKGLNPRNPRYAFITLLMFSMAGIPPTVGIYAKLSVLEAVLNAGYVWLAVLAVLLSLVDVFYYLRIVKLMYFDEPETNASIATQGDVKLIDKRERNRNTCVRSFSADIDCFAGTRYSTPYSVGSRRSMPAAIGPIGCGYGKMMPLPISHFKTRSLPRHLISQFQVVSGVNKRAGN